MTGVPSAIPSDSIGSAWLSTKPGGGHDAIVGKAEAHGSSGIVQHVASTGARVRETRRRRRYSPIIITGRGANDQGPRPIQHRSESPTRSSLRDRAAMASMGSARLGPHKMFDLQGPL